MYRRRRDGGSAARNEYICKGMRVAYTYYVIRSR